jgi:hypothetical protein
MLCRRCLLVWKRATVKDLCVCLGSRSGSKPSKGRKDSPLSACGDHVQKGISRELRRWSESGKGWAHHMVELKVLHGQRFESRI